MKFHPAADIFPLMEKDELKRLADDIKANGLNEPITVYDGAVLDGRNRLRACEMSDVKPRFQNWKNGYSPTVWVVSQNLHRRHLTESQKAAIAVDVEAMLAKEIPKGRPKKDSKSRGISGEAAEIAGKSLGVSRAYVAAAKQLGKRSPGLLREVKEGKKTLREAKSALLAKEEHKAMEAALETVDLPDSCDLRTCSMQELLTSGIEPDSVITDPPYPEEFLPVYEDLAKACKNVPLVAVMCGQTYLPQIMALMCPHLEYRWTLCYLTPGSQLRQWQRKVDCGWKPVLLFGKPQGYLFDLVKSDADDKRFHGWGQSESGFLQLVDRLTKPGQLVCDPFLGGGTTAICSLALGRRFVGCDVDEKAVKMSQGRVAKFLNDKRAAK